VVLRPRLAAGLPFSRALHHNMLPSAPKNTPGRKKLTKNVALSECSRAYYFLGALRNPRWPGLPGRCRGSERPMPAARGYATLRGGPFYLAR
jgi:hypothetical protein